MSLVDERECWVPERVRERLRLFDFLLSLESLEGFIREWHEWMQATGAFYDYKDTDGFGRVYAVHRRSLRAATDRGSPSETMNWPGSGGFWATPQARSCYR